MQEALLAAATRWPTDGVPDDPRAWLVTTANRRYLDTLRSDSARRTRERRVSGEPAPGAATQEDDSLVVLFLCCHPALRPASAIALALRAVGGLTTAEIARAYGVPEATMAQRISRAKKQVVLSGRPFALPMGDERDERLRSVLHVLYLMFNEGYTARTGDTLVRADLCDEAVRLARMVVAAFPDEAEAAGLLALMLLLDARRPARTDAAGNLLPLPAQDRTRWDTSAVAEGLALVDRLLTRGAVGEYQLQAAIAAEHDRAPTADATDWPRIAALYALLEDLTGSLVVTLNRAVAVAMVDGPHAGLAVLDRVQEAVPDDEQHDDERRRPTAFAGDPHRLPTLRAHLLEQTGDTAGALREYRRAHAVVTNLAERRHLAAQIARLERG